QLYLRSDTPPRDRLHPPRQRFVETASELQIVGGVDGAVAVEIEEWLVAAADGFVEGRAKGQVIAGVYNGREIAPRPAARGSGRGARVAEKAVERRRGVGGQRDAGVSEQVDLGGVDTQVVDAVFERVVSIGAILGVADERDDPTHVVGGRKV